MNSSLEGKVVLVSGGTKGVGEAIARRVAAAGAAGLLITGRSAERGSRLAAELNAVIPTDYQQVDLADVEAARGSVHRSVERFGRIDAVISAAGLTSRGSMLDTTPELFDSHIAVNLRAPFFIMAETIKHLKDRGAPGSILNVITISELGGQPYLAPYVAAKAGLAGATRNAAYAHRWDRIRINGLDIGWTATEAEAAVQKKEHDAGDDWLTRADASVPMGHISRPEEIAEIAVFLISDASGVVTGSVIDWDQRVIGGMD